MEGITYIEHFLEDHQSLFKTLETFAKWDNTMSARKTVSYGVAYNYSQMSYPFLEIPSFISTVMQKVNDTLGFEPNNCLINYYLDGQSKMGFHADQTDILAQNTGIAILSLGATRILRFRKIDKKEEIHDFPLPSGSLFYMTQEIQQEWQHAIPTTDIMQGRMSLTFRKILS